MDGPALPRSMNLTRGLGLRRRGAADASGSAAYGATAPATTSFATEGVYDLTFTVTDATTSSGQDSVRITVLNQPPAADAGGPYTVPEGSSVQLDGTGSYDPDPGDTLTYAWDLDNDGTFETAGATPTSPPSMAPPASP